MPLLNISIFFLICIIKFGVGVPPLQPVTQSPPPANCTEFNLNGFASLNKNVKYPGYLLFENGLYKYHRDVQKWPAARKICDAEGGHLVIINSEDEVLIVRQLMAKYPSNVLSDVQHKDQVLIGLHDLFKEGEFVTIDGKSLESSGYNYWEPGQPNNFPNQNCGSITRTGGLNDFPCDVPSPFICEIPLENPFCMLSKIL